MYNVNKHLACVSDDSKRKVANLHQTYDSYEEHWLALAVTVAVVVVVVEAFFYFSVTLTMFASGPQGSP